MDEITHAALLRVSDINPGAAITFTHQFLDGVKGVECGLVPDDWNGKIVTIKGHWWINGEQKKFG